MATNYPGAIDTYTNPLSSEPMNAPSHAGQHANANDAVEAIETELGTDPSGSAATVKSRLDGIEDGTRLGANSVGATQIANDSVDTAAIQDNAVTADKIAADAVGSSEIAANAVGSSELADNAVDTAAIADSAVTSAKIADGSIVNADIDAAAAIAATKISGTALVASTVDAKGDLYVGTAADTVARLAVGSNGAVLVADSAQTAGVRWTTARRLEGTGAPEGAVTAPPGSTFLQTDSTTDVKGWIRWIKATGTGSTGWIAGPEADTGRRDVSALLLNSWTTASAVYIRRIGYTVHLYGAIRSQDGNASSMEFLAQPTGFGIQPVAVVGWVYNTSTGTASHAIRGGAGNWTLLGSEPSNQNLNFHISAPVDVLTQTWPSSLPGVAA